MSGTAHGAGARRHGRVRAARARLRRRLPLFERAARRAGRPSASRRTSRTTPTSRGSSPIDAGHRRGRQDHRLHARSATRASTSRRTRPATTSRSSRSPRRCMHLGCPVRYVQAAQRFICPCHGGVYDFQRQGRRRPAGAPARPLLHARRATARSRSARATRSTRELKRFPPTATRPAPRRHRPVPLPRAASRRPKHRRGCRLKLPKPPLPTRCQPAPASARARPSSAQAARAGQGGRDPRRVGWIDERTSLSGGRAAG